MAKKQYLTISPYTKRNLPAGYTQALYIQSHGAEYVDTNFQPTSEKLRVVVDYEYTQSPNGKSLFGSQSASTTFPITFYHTSATVGSFYVGSTHNILNLDVATGTRKTLDCTANNGSFSCTYGGATKTASYSGTLSNGFDLAIFTNNIQDSDTTSQRISARLFSYLIYDNDVLTRDYVPCYVDATGEYGLYDMVTQSFYGNKGTGAFSGLRIVELPEGYTQIECIESSGSQYIDTGVIAKTGISMTADWALTNVTSNVLAVSGATNGTIGIYPIFHLNTWVFAYYDLYYSSVTAKAGQRYRLESKMLSGNQTLSADGNVIVSKSFTTDYNVGLPLYLFALNVSGTAKDFSASECYSCQIYEGSTLVRDYIPCVTSAGVAGLYDLVTNVFYGNAGTGTFATGEVIGNTWREVKKRYLTISSLPAGYTEAKYIESDGTQYIDTGYVPRSDNFRIVVDFEYTTDPKNTALFGAESGTTRNWSILANSSPVAFYIGSSQDILKQTVSVNTRYLLDAHAQGGRLSTIWNGAPTSTTYSGSLDKVSPMYLFAHNWNGTAALFCSAKYYSCKIYDNDVLVRDYIPCVTSTGVAGLFDIANSVFYGNAGSGVFTAGETLNKKFRKVKKGYLTIGGLFRPFISGGVPTYYGAVTGLSVARTASAGGNIGDYAVFAGGRNSSTIYSTVDIYNASFTRQTATSMSIGRWNHASCNVGKYLLFAGGNKQKEPDNYFTDSIDAYDAALTRTSVRTMSANSGYLGAAAVGDYAVFAGGTNGSNSFLSTVDAYNSSLTRTTATLNQSRREMGSASTDTRAIFAGGLYNSNNNYSRNTVEAFDASLTRSALANLATSKYQLAGARAGEYAVFAGGNSSNTVEAYSASLTKTTAINLTVARGRMASGSLGEYAVFAGGLGVTNVVEMYDASLIQTTPAVLSAASVDPAAANVGEALLISGGATNAVQMNPVGTMDAFVLD